MSVSLFSGWNEPKPLKLRLGALLGCFVLDLLFVLHGVKLGSGAPDYNNFRTFFDFTTYLAVHPASGFLSLALNILVPFMIPAALFFLPETRPLRVRAATAGTVFLTLWCWKDVANAGRPGETPPYGNVIVAAAAVLVLAGIFFCWQRLASLLAPLVKGRRIPRPAMVILFCLAVPAWWKITGAGEQIGAIAVFIGVPLLLSAYVACLWPLFRWRSLALAALLAGVLELMIFTGTFGLSHYICPAPAGQNFGGYESCYWIRW